MTSIEPPETASAADLQSALVTTSPFSDRLGLHLIEVTPTKVVARWNLSGQLHQPYGIVHGGAHAAVVETVGSIGGYIAVQDQAKVVGVNNNTDFYRAVSEGVLDVVGVPLHQGRSQQVWQVEIRDERQRLVARGTLRLQNLYAPKD